MLYLRREPDDLLDRHVENAKILIHRTAGRIHRAQWHEGRECVKQAIGTVTRWASCRYSRAGVDRQSQQERKTIATSSMSPHTRIARLNAPIVLAHGLFGFARIGVGRLSVAAYFRGIPQAIEAAGNRVLVTRVPSIAGIDTRARELGDQILRAFPDERVHLIGHSMGGLDARRLLAEPRWQKRVLSLTTIGTPHLGTALADFAKLRVGRIYRLMTALGIDPQGCLDITRRAARRFHRNNRAPDGVPCFSVAGDAISETVCWPLERTFAALWEVEGPNDGLVPVESALAFGSPLPLSPLDHLRQLNWLIPDENSPLFPPPIELYARVVGHLESLS
jgi:triacylglycerol lipase